MIVATFEIMVADGPGTPDGGSVTSMTGRRAAYGADDLRARTRSSSASPKSDG
jgi:hypothetical protein